MMKKMVSMAMAAVMALTLMVAVAPAEVKAADMTTPVSYTNNSVLETESGIKVTVKIPTSITFTEDSKKIDANVSIEPADAEDDIAEYTGNIAVTVESANGYTLTMAGADPLSYKLAYGSNPEGTVGTLDKDTTLIQGTATLEGTATVVGTYTDTLTYKLAITEQ